MLKRVKDPAKSQELLGGWKGLETSSSKNLGKLDIGEGDWSVSFPHYHDSFGVNFGAGQTLHMSRFSYGIFYLFGNAIGQALSFGANFIIWLDKKRKDNFIRRVAIIFGSEGWTPLSLVMLNIKKKVCP